jgi:hypothetical protein
MGQKRYERGTDARGVTRNGQEDKQKDLKQLLTWYKRRYVMRVPQVFVHAASIQVQTRIPDPIAACIIE